MCAVSIGLCEGPSDEDFLEALKAVRGGLEHIEISKKKDETPSGRGWGAFKDRLEALRYKKIIKKCDAIFLIADNNGDPQQRVREIKAKIEETGLYNVPPAAWMPSQKGILPPTHILTLPSKDAPGCLETLLIQALEDRKPHLRGIADAYFAEMMKTAAPGAWSVSKMAKLRLRIELAADNPQDPLLPFGKLWRGENGEIRDLIGLDHPCFDGLVGYLRGLKP